MESGDLSSASVVAAPRRSFRERQTVRPRQAGSASSGEAPARPERRSDSYASAPVRKPVMRSNSEFGYLFNDSDPSDNHMDEQYSHRLDGLNYDGRSVDSDSQYDSLLADRQSMVRRPENRSSAASSSSGESSTGRSRFTRRTRESSSADAYAASASISAAELSAQEETPVTQPVQPAPQPVQPVQTADVFASPVTEPAPSDSLVQPEPVSAEPVTEPAAVESVPAVISVYDSPSGSDSRYDSDDYGYSRRDSVRRRRRDRDDDYYYRRDRRYDDDYGYGDYDYRDRRYSEPYPVYLAPQPIYPPYVQYPAYPPAYPYPYPYGQYPAYPVYGQPPVYPPYAYPPGTVPPGYPYPVQQQETPAAAPEAPAEPAGEPQPPEAPMPFPVEEPITMTPDNTENEPVMDYPHFPISAHSAWKQSPAEPTPEPEPAPAAKPEPVPAVEPEPAPAAAPEPAPVSDFSEPVTQPAAAPSPSGSSRFNRRTRSTGDSADRFAPKSDSDRQQKKKEWSFDRPASRSDDFAPRTFAPASSNPSSLNDSEDWFGESSTSSSDRPAGGSSRFNRRTRS